MDLPLSCYTLITNYILISYAKGHSDQTNTCSVLEVSLHFVTSDPLLPYIWHKWQFLELKNPYLHTKTTDMCQFGAKILFLYFLGAILDFESILNLGCLTWKAITQLDSLTSKTNIYTKKSAGLHHFMGLSHWGDFVVPQSCHWKKMAKFHHSPVMVPLLASTLLLLPSGIGSGASG